MGTVQIVATVLAAAITVVAVALAVRAVLPMTGGDPARPARPGALRRQGHPARRPCWARRSATPGCSSGAWSAPRTGS